MRWRCLLILLLLVAPSSATWDADAAFVDASLRDFLGDVNDTALVLGTHVTPAERMMLAYAKQSYGIIERIPVVSDAELPVESSLLLIGGPTQNRITANLFSTQELNVTRLTYGVYANGTIDGRRIVVMSDYAGFHNLPPKTSSSPLSRFIPEAYVPAAAAVIGFTLLWLWKFIFAFLERIARLVISSKVLAKVRKRELKAKYRGFTLRGVRIKYREVAAICVAAIVFAAAVATTYLTPALRWIIVATIASNIIIYAVRNGVRLVMDRHHELHTEYVVWYWGALITMISGWLGATFALAGYIVSDGKKHDLEGKIAFWTDACSFGAALVFIIWNLLSPAILLQMISVLALTLSVVQMLPFEPFNGRKVLAWKRSAWWLLFLPMLAVYLVVIIW